MKEELGEQRLTKSAPGPQLDRSLASLKGTAGLSTPEKLALAARVLAAEGHCAGLAGQITARAASSREFLTLALGVGFDEACQRDFIGIDDDINIIDGEGTPNPATRFHLWIYRHRPHVQAIIHTHPPRLLLYPCSEHRLSSPTWT